MYLFTPIPCSKISIVVCLNILNILRETIYYTQRLISYSYYVWYLHSFLNEYLRFIQIEQSCLKLPRSNTCQNRSN